MKRDRIEEVYSELKSFSKEPPKELWDNIEARLHPKKKRRVIFWFWGSAAAVLVLLFGFLLFKPVSKIDKPIDEPVNQVSDIEQKQLKNSAKESVSDSNNINKEIIESKISKDSIEKRTKDQLANKDSSSNNNKNQIVEDLKKQSLNKSLKNKSEVTNANNSYIQDNPKGENGKNNELTPNLLKNNKSLITDAKETAIVGLDSITKEKTDVKLDLYKELMAENSNKKDSVNTDVANSSKWSFEILGGLSNTASDASFQGTSINTSAQNDFVYSFKVGYAISDKLLIKTGVGKNSLGQQINNIAYASTDGSLASDGGQSIVSDESLVFFGSTELANDATSFEEYSENGTLQQQLDYVQVPLDIFYKLLTKEKYDISIGVGGNVNFISNNKAYLNDEEIGESIGINNTVFGAALNTNVSYYLTKKTILFLEPSYNYFQKPIDNNAQNFKNTQLRVLFGLRFKL